MTTPPPDTKVQGETPRQIAERVVLDACNNRSVKQVNPRLLSALEIVYEGRGASWPISDDTLGVTKMQSDREAIQQRFKDDQREIEAIRERIAAEYRHEPGEQYTPMLRDLRMLSGYLNLTDEFWESAEKELNEVRDCDKCDLCEDHHANS